MPELTPNSVAIDRVPVGPFLVSDKNITTGSNQTDEWVEFYGFVYGCRGYMVNSGSQLLGNEPNAAGTAESSGDSPGKVGVNAVAPVSGDVSAWVR